MHKLTKLDNGLRILTKKLEGTQSVTVLVLVGAGSRYETKEMNGISHFLEHMFFKGAKKYKNTKEVSEAIDSVGGDFNAFTGKEYAGYYVKVAAEKINVAMDVLSDMLIHARFDTEEINKERGVILEELNMYQDTPMYQIGWNFEQQVFGNQPIGWDQIGTKELINTVTQEQFQEYQESLYTPDNTVISIVGNIDHDKAVEMTKEYFQLITDSKKLEFKPFEEGLSEEHLMVTTKKTEQAHLVMGFKGLPYRHKDEWTQKLLATVLGGNMSSRMFLNVREAQGLCYYVRTSTDSFTDVGLISTRAGVDVTRIQDAIDAIAREYKNIKGELIDEKELTKAKEYLKGKIVLRLEDSEEYAHMLGRQELLHNNIDDPNDIIQKIESVTPEDIQALTEQLFTKENLYLNVIGPYKVDDLKLSFE
jgi:predicted Zn-dependent peptidase